MSAVEIFAELEKAQKFIADTLTALKDKIIGAVADQRPYGTVSGDGVMIVKMSIVAKEDNWSPDYFLPKSQAFAVASAFRNADTFDTLCKKVSELLQEDTPLVRLGAHHVIRLNPRTIEILRNSELGKFVQKKTEV